MTNDASTTVHSGFYMHLGRKALRQRRLDAEAVTAELRAATESTEGKESVQEFGSQP